MTTNKKTQAMTLLFRAFGQGNDNERMAIYIQLLSQELSEDVLVLVVEKAIRVCKYLPTIAELLSMAESLRGSVTRQGIPSWAEAWGEIQRAMYTTWWGEQPSFTHPAIAEAVKAYGWTSIQGARAEDMPTISAQLRRIYDETAKRSREQAENTRLIRKSPRLLAMQQKMLKGAPK